MNSILIIFLLLIVCLVLSSVLANIQYESFTVVSDSSGNTTNYATNSSVGSSTFSSTTDPNNNTTTYDNYNHYTKSSDSNSNLISGTIFYGPNGGQAIVVTGSDGQKLLKIVLPNEYTPYVYSYVSVNTWTGSNGTATIVQSSGGNSALKISLNNGQTYIYTVSSTNPPPPPPESSTSSSVYGNDYKNQYYNTSSTYETEPQSQSQSQANTSYSTSYQSYDPTTNGIPKSMIPPGDEDLYILKTSIVPPVCPMCPSPIITDNSSSNDKCPPCPACARCPEPNFECKKVPNYNAVNNPLIPQPILSDYSQYGM